MHTTVDRQVRKLAEKLGLPLLIYRPPSSRKPPFDRNLALLAVLAFLSIPLSKTHLEYIFCRDRRDIAE